MDICVLLPNMSIAQTHICIFVHYTQSSDYLMCSANRFSFTKLMDDPDRTSEKEEVPQSLVAFLMAPPAVQPSAPLLAARADVW